MLQEIYFWILERFKHFSYFYNNFTKMTRKISTKFDLSAKILLIKQNLHVLIHFIFINFQLKSSFSMDDFLLLTTIYRKRNLVGNQT